jgi:hypothetical protein
MTIQVDADIDTIFRDYVFVKRNKPTSCGCMVEKMSPVTAVNLHWQTRICAECGGTISEAAYEAYDRYYGYSGYDEPEEY